LREWRLLTFDSFCQFCNSSHHSLIANGNDHASGRPFDSVSR
jgi:hypothetical protein